MTEISTAAPAVVTSTEGMQFETASVELIPAVSPRYLQPSMDVSEITRILSRPCTFASGVLPTTGNTIISRATITTNSLATRWSQLFEYYGIRATVVFRLMVVATPTDAGLYGLCWDPTIGTGVSTIVRCHMASLMQLPGKVFNISQTRDVELRMPWVQPYEFANLAATVDGLQGGLSWGAYSFYSITPRVSGVDSTNPTYRILMWLEDVNLYGVRGTVVAVP